MKDIAWWSVYEIGQRLCDKFDDVPDGAAAPALPRVFIAGDACHTHSAKAGQGMNVSMQDALQPRLEARRRCCEGRRAPELLHTYSAERQAIAQELIDFDREWSKHVQRAEGAGSRRRGVDPAEFQRYFVAARPLHRRRRDPVQAVADHAPSPRISISPQGFPIGMRFHSAPVIRLADAKPMQLGHVARADGAWRIYVFADPRTASQSRIARCASSWRLRAVADPALHAGGADIDSRDRRPRHLPAGPSRPRRRRPAAGPAARGRAASA